MRVKEGDKWNMAFRTKFGRLETLVMPLGLTNAPAVFQHLMNDLLHDLLDTGVLCYLDDILIYSPIMEGYVKLVKAVLRRLQQANLFCKASKSSLHTMTVKYLRIVITLEGMSLDKAKVKVVMEWPNPNTVRKMQSFLGFANFLQRFVKDFSQITCPFTT